MAEPSSSVARVGRAESPAHPLSPQRAGASPKSQLNPAAPGSCSRAAHILGGGKRAAPTSLPCRNEAINPGRYHGRVREVDLSLAMAYHFRLTDLPGRPSWPPYRCRRCCRRRPRRQSKDRRGGGRSSQSPNPAALPASMDRTPEGRRRVIGTQWEAGSACALAVASHGRLRACAFAQGVALASTQATCVACAWATCGQSSHRQWRLPTASGAAAPGDAHGIPRASPPLSVGPELI